MSFADRVRESCTVSGLGDITLTGATTAYQSFTDCYADLEVVTYVIVCSDNSWEIGQGVFSTSGNSISRDSVFSSSDNNDPITFGAGSFIVFNDVAAAQISTTPGSRTIPLGRADANPDIDGTIDPLWLPGVIIHEDANFKFEMLAYFGALVSLTHATLITLDLDNSNNFLITPTSNGCDIEVDNHTIGQVIIIKLIGGKTVNWFDGISWDRDTEPSLAGAADDWTIVELICTGEDVYDVPQWTEVSRSSSIGTTSGAVISTITTGSTPTGGSDGDVTIDTKYGYVWQRTGGSWNIISGIIPTEAASPVGYYPLVVQSTAPTYANLGGKLSTDVTSTSWTSGGGLADLKSYSVVANQLSFDGQSIEFEFAFSFAANGNNKTITVVFGSTTIYNSGAQAQNGGSLYLRGKIYRSGAATQVITMQGFGPTGFYSVVTPYQTSSETLSGALTLKARANGTTTGDVQQKLLDVAFHDRGN